jgi:hypothetical protein
MRRQRPWRLPFLYGRAGAVEGITNESNPTKAAQQDRQFAYNRGSELDTSLLDDQNRAAFERNAFQNKLGGAYDPMLAGRAGSRRSSSRK